MSDLASAVFSVVMVGHSLFGATAPDMLEAALSATSSSVEVRAQITNGAPLKYNWDRSRDAEGIDARAVLPQGTTTDLILTEAIPLANHLKWSETGVYAQAFAGLNMTTRPRPRGASVCKRIWRIGRASLRSCAPAFLTAKRVSN